MAGPTPWNHNLHDHHLVLNEAAGCATALDAGCGDGLLARDLHRQVPDVTAIDADAAVLNRARVLDPGVAWVLGDALSHDFGRRFDLVASIATLHHLPDLAAGLRRLAELTAPGGRLVVIGLARADRLVDLLPDLVAVPANLARRAQRGYWQHTAPTCWPPPHSYTDVRRTVTAELPAARYRRLLFWRYCVQWRKPA